MPNLVSVYAQAQRRRTLRIVISVVLVASLLLSWTNLRFSDEISEGALVGLALMCLISLGLNEIGHYRAAAILVSAALLLAINLNIYAGDGLYDMGVVAYPLFIILGTLLLGKRASIGFAAVAIVSVGLIAYLQKTGMIVPSINNRDISNWITLVILLGGATLIVWVMMDNSEKNLSQIMQSDLELRQAYEMTLAGWAKALEYRDQETEGHSRRVVDLCERLAKELGCSEAEIINLRRGAYLHDIGKLAIPDAILFKPAGLDDEERSVIRMHPVYAKEMLAEIAFLQPAIGIPYHHHERWDGCGYPEGLKGEEIPLGARIFSVVDNWDALCSKRPYREAWSNHEALDYIQANSGIMFDPRIVEVFMRVISGQSQSG